MLDHVGLPVSDYARSLAFYTHALAPLGLTLMHEMAQEEIAGARAAGFGSDGNPCFWIGDDGAPTQHTHVAFAVDDRAAVDAFHAAALSAGGRDNGPPGLRPRYHPEYYAAFVLDPDGHNIEAVCHRPETGA
jgi:catechol 2,3-dioxygenase-like lactoylglutathione lyase family enzyme